MESSFFPKGGVPPSVRVRLTFLDPERPGSPYHGFIGNRKAVQQLMRIDFGALGRYNHSCGEVALVFVGPPGSGKTELARRHANANSLATVECSANALTSVDALLQAMKSVCAAASIPLIEVYRPKLYKVPPINVFIDDADSLNGLVGQVLSRGTVSPNRELETESGFTVDCSDIHWMIATTESGNIPEPLREGRFALVSLSLYSQEEIAQIVKHNYPDWDTATCRLVAKYCPHLPSQALAFATDLYLEQKLNHGRWEEAAARVASARGMIPQRETIESASAETLLTALSVTF
jgi:SpoVK/Ycf46/Vps4 family AAA+-type ATPase